MSSAAATASACKAVFMQRAVGCVVAVLAASIDSVIDEAN